MELDPNWKMDFMRKVGLICIAFDGADVEVLGPAGDDGMQVRVMHSPDGKCVGMTGVVLATSVQPYNVWAAHKD